MTIFGDGFIAKNLKKINLPKKFFIYAAGISNSNNKQNKDYRREIVRFNKIINEISPKKIFIYISTTSVKNKNLAKDKYIKNKLIIENIIKKKIKNYVIIRLSQVVGKNQNKYTVTNFIYNTIKESKKFYLWKHAKRNLIDIDDVLKIIKIYLTNHLKINSIINIFNPRSIAVKRIIKIFGKILLKKIIIKELKKENKNINIKVLKKNIFLPTKYYNKMNNDFYVQKVLRKYYK